MTDRVLVVGGGTREQHLAWKLAQSANVKQVLVAPGNANTANRGKINNSGVLISNPNLLKQFCIDHNIALVVVNQISLLTGGLVDDLTAAGVRCFGPTAKASQLEANKIFAKEFMDQFGIPSARWRSFTDPQEACRFINCVDFPALVVKPCSSSREVCMANDKDEACQAVQLLTQDTWTAHETEMESFFIEERLEGVEFLCLAVSDGKSLYTVPPVEIEKNLNGESQSQVSRAVQAHRAGSKLLASSLMNTQDKILEQVSDAMRQEGMSYAGIIGARIMLTNRGPLVLGLKCSFQTLECQAILPLLEMDLYKMIQAAVEGRIHQCLPESAQDWALVSYPMRIATNGRKGDGPPVPNHVDMLNYSLASTSLQGKGCQLPGAKSRENIEESLDWSVPAIREGPSDSVQSTNIGCGLSCSCLPLTAVQFKDPLLVCTTNSAEAQIKIARTCHQYNMAAQHLVAKCVNDILGYGAQVLFFMPYITCGKADEDVAKSLVDGLATACSKAGSTLLEREIVHVADLYPEGSRTLSGCSIGIVEREHKLPRLNKMKEGDVVIGLPDTGLHCNSSSLIGNILHKCSADYGSSLPVYNEEKSWGDLLVSPSPIYSQMLLSCIQSGHVRAFAAVTEKGLLGTIHHLLPDYLGVIVDALFWTIPAVFSWLYQEGALSELEMVNNFNCGIGAVLIAQKSAAQELVSQLHKQEEAWVIGALIQHQTGQTRVRVTHLLEALRVNSFPITRKIEVNPAPGNARKVAVFISDPGTRLKLLTDFTRQPRSCARLSLVLSNKSTVEELRRSAGAGIPTRVIDHTLCQCHSEFEATICNVLKEFSIDLICLAGFVRNLSNPFLDKWKGKILTLCPLISPSLEPKQCQESGVRVNGCTVRYMLVGTTPGPVILQETFKAEEDIDQSVAEQMEEAKSRAITKSICLVASGLVQLGEDGCISWNYLE